MFDRSTDIPARPSRLGAGRRAFQVELAFDGLVDRFDDLAQRLEEPGAAPAGCPTSGNTRAANLQAPLPVAVHPVDAAAAAAFEIGPGGASSSDGQITPALPRQDSGWATLRVLLPVFPARGHC